MVFAIEEDGISAITGFADPGLGDPFGLPSRLPPNRKGKPAKRSDVKQATLSVGESTFGRAVPIICKDVARMAWIKIVDEADADAKLRSLYDRTVDPQTGRVDEIMRIHSLHPAGLASHNALYTSVMRSTATLRKTEREMIALVVSALNDCHY